MGNVTSAASVLAAQPLPAGVIRAQSLDHNIAYFQSYCDQHAVSLAPHVKTTMAREIFSRQKRAGAWGATVATVAQAAILRSWGQERILIANQVTDAAGIAWLVKESQRPDVELVCWVDSQRGVDLLARQAVRAGPRPVRAALEVGHNGGRTGVRAGEECLELARYIATQSAVDLVGVAAFEGTIVGSDRSASRTMVSEFLSFVAAVAEDLANQRLFDSDQPFVSAGGSAHFDQVIERFSDLVPRGFRVVLRSGCYVTHDCGAYDELSPMGSAFGGQLRPALEVWGSVLSTPESGLALVGVGKRDVSYDAGMPIPIATWRDGQLAGVDGELEVFTLNDQHAYLRDAGGLLTPGDLVGFGISHPCTTFDKWRRFTLVDEQLQSVGEVVTEFP